MPTIWDVNFGREFIGGPEALEKQGQKICGKKLLEEFADICRQFSKYFARPAIKIQLKSALQSLENKKLPGVVRTFPIFIAWSSSLAACFIALSSQKFLRGKALGGSESESAGLFTTHL